MKSQTIELERNKNITIEIFENGTYGLDLDQDFDGVEQSVYFKLTQSELQCLVNMLANAQQTRRNYLKDMLKKVSV